MKLLIGFIILFITACTDLPNIDSTLDTFIGAKETEVIKAFGSPTSIDEEKLVYYTIRQSCACGQKVYSSYFPDGINMYKKYNKIEFHLKNKTIQFWIGYKE